MGDFSAGEMRRFGCVLLWDDLLGRPVDMTGVSHPQYLDERGDLDHTNAPSPRISAQLVAGIYHFQCTYF